MKAKSKSGEIREEFPGSYAPAPFGRPCHQSEIEQNVKRSRLGVYNWMFIAFLLLDKWVRKMVGSSWIRLGEKPKRGSLTSTQELLNHTTVS